MGKLRDFTGERIGLLTVIERANAQSKNRSAIWVCKCDCGNIKNMSAAVLARESTMSCGCFKPEQRQLKQSTYIFKDNYIEVYRWDGLFICLCDIEDYEIIKDYNWYLDKGYATAHMGMVRIDGRKKEQKIAMARLLMNPQDNERVDHADGNTQDNRRNNLRNCIVSQNRINSVVSPNNTSGHKGVYWHNQSQRWRAAININTVEKCLGNFANIEDAIKAREEAEKEYYGEFARHP